jgi:lipid-binding SYLF domain-containing protein
MCRTFTITIPSDEPDYLENVKSSAEGMGAVFAGDETRGSFSGRGIEGEYLIEGNRLTVTIKKKPAIAPWPIIESLVRGFFE